MSADHDSFPPLPKNRIEVGDVVRYLTELSAQGHQVNRDSEQQHVFYLQLSEAYRIRVSVGNGSSQLQLQWLGNLQTFLNASSVAEFERAVRHLVEQIGMSWPFRPSAGRLDASTPATNYRTISELVGSSQVEAVFDPYLTNRGLEELRVFLSFGDGTVASGIRLLGSTATTTGKQPRLTKAGVDAWLRQLGIPGDARVVPAKSEHRRFLLLSGGQSLLLGHSLNDLHKNEAVRLESDSTDRPFFDSTWAGAVLLT